MASVVGKRNVIQYHKWVAVWAGITVLVWGVSGLLHPVMAWFSPQSKVFFPPKLLIESTQIGDLSDILSKHQITDAAVLRVVPSSRGAVLQLTSEERTPRRYFSLTDGKELDDFDQQHARWLAVYYTGLSQEKISRVEFKTEFDRDYPWVNRLLPVYKIQFETDDATTAFIHTETNALASLNNSNKRSFQRVFQALHTWNWFNHIEMARVLIIACLCIVLMAAASSGFAMIVLLKSRKIPNRSRYWHRLLGYCIWIPLLAWSASGFYHLLKSAYVQPIAGMRLLDTINTRNLSVNTKGDWLEPYLLKRINAVSIVPSRDGQLLYRLSIANGDKQQTVSKTQRFAGKPKEFEAHYVDVSSGQQSMVTDKEHAIWLAGLHSQLPIEQITRVQLVTRFGPDYDFRNKRLPVWQIDYASDEKLSVFIDPATGILVDQNRQADRLESLSFSMLHKWNFLRPITGRFWRDQIIVLFLLLSIVSAGLGLTLWLKRRRHRVSNTKVLTSAAGSPPLN